MNSNDELIKYSIPQLLRWRVKTSPRRTALKEKDYGIWNSYTWEDYYDYVRKTALGLKAIGLGKDNTIAIISDNIPELLFVAIGGHSISRYLSNQHAPRDCPDPEVSKSECRILRQPGAGG